MAKSYEKILVAVDITDELDEVVSSASEVARQHDAELHFDRRAWLRRHAGSNELAPAVLELVLEKGITIEACPTSNWQTQTIERFEDHPLKRWLAHGVKACVCADNTYLSATDAAKEMELVVERLGIDEAERESLIEAGHAAAFR